MTRRIVLGPQRPTANLAAAAAGLPDAPVAVISAGWKEAEGFIDDVAELVPHELVDLGLNGRAEAAFAADSRLFAAHEERQHKLKDLQRLYRLRLRQLMIAARQVMRDGAAPEMIEAARGQAISQIRELDRQHVAQSRAIHERFHEDLEVVQSEPLAEQIQAVEELLAPCPVLLLTGGNVAVLANRLRLFNDAPWLEERTLVAWSAGAMALSEAIVLFNDHTPQGRREPEVLMAGAGILPGMVFLPGASRRLKINNTRNMALMASRFEPASCVVLDSGSLLEFEGQRLTAASGAQVIGADGRLTELNPP